MNLKSKHLIRRSVAAVLGCGAALGVAATAHASSVTVTDTTDWNTTPMEIVNANLPYLNYNGGVYAGINDFTVFDGVTTTSYAGFCIDPFHWSLNGPVTGYSEVPITSGPKSPGTLNASSAIEIEKLWAMYFSPTMTSYNAAGLQIAIWDIVSANAVANNGLPSNEAFSLDNPNADFGAAADIAAAANYGGPLANLMVLTGPGQDYVISVPPTGGGSRTPDAASTGLLLGTAACAMAAVRPMQKRLAMASSK